MSNDLIQPIQQAQTRAGEDVVVASLRASGLVQGPTLEELKATALAKLRDAERAMFTYFSECPIGDERVRASQVYENIRNATRI